MVTTRLVPSPAGGTSCFVSKVSLWWNHQFPRISGISHCIPRQVEISRNSGFSPKSGHAELHCHCHWRQQLALGTRTTVLSFSVCYCCLLFIRMQFFIEVVKLILLCGKVWCCYSLSLCCLSLLFSYESIPEFKSHTKGQSRGAVLHWVQQQLAPSKTEVR